MAGFDESPDLQGAALDSQSGNDDPWIGQTLGAYSILKRIGVGGMGVVYLARHESLERLVAVKFLPAQMVEDESYVQLFLREAKAAARLSHPNIITVHDAGHLGKDVYYFIMEYVEGRDLGSVLQEKGAVPVMDAVNYIRQAASALEYAHRLGVVHRDIKPENLMLTPQGKIKIGDLGLAKWIGDENTAMTQSGCLLGSPIYIAPERLKDPGINDPRCDIYSLGGTFHHLVTGKVPYNGSSPVIMSMHLTAPVPDPRDSNPLVDSEICALVRKMMAKDPGDRPQSMEEIDSTLAQYQIKSAKLVQSAVALEAPEMAKQEPAETNPMPPPRGSKGGLMAVVVAVILVAAIGGYFWMRGAGPSDAKPPEVKSPDGVPAAATDSVPPPTSASPEAPVEKDSSLVLAGFDRPGDAQRIDVWTSPAPEQAVCYAGIRPGKGLDGSAGWRIDYDISKGGATALAKLNIKDVDATPYKSIIFESRVEGADSVTYAVDVQVGRAQRRFLVRNVGKDWKKVKIPFTSLSLPSLKPLNQLTVTLERESTAEKKATIYIDEIALSTD